MSERNQTIMLGVLVVVLIVIGLGLGGFYVLSPSMPPQQTLSAISTDTIGGVCIEYEATLSAPVDSREAQVNATVVAQSYDTLCNR